MISIKMLAFMMNLAKAFGYLSGSDVLRCLCRPHKTPEPSIIGSMQYFHTNEVNSQFLMLLLIVIRYLELYSSHPKVLSNDLPL